MQGVEAGVVVSKKAERLARFNKASYRKREVIAFISHTVRNCASTLF